MEAVLEDYRTAPIDERTRAALAFLRKLTLDPASVGPADAAEARAAGVSDAALREAIYVATLFNTIDRMADALGFDLLPEEGYRGAARFLVASGYEWG
ncbi:MAG TPA: hypothetical protein VF520_10105 [Thermoleophilaceae bacterium]